MKFQDTPIPGPKLIHLDIKGDERGFFARQFCRKEFAEQNLEKDFVQVNTSFSAQRGTLRGLHYQLGEAAETKLVRCIRGAIWDCVLDLRPESPNFGQWFGAELSAHNRQMMYVPKGFAHGFISLSPDSEIFYFVDNYYNPDLERGVRWDDARFGIEWPLTPEVISDRDLQHPNFNPAHHLASCPTSLAP